MTKVAKSVPAASRTDSTSALSEANHVASTLVGKGYRLGPRIGKGSYAKVKVTQRIKDGVIVAAKIISRQRAAKEFLRRFLPREISILLSVRHPSIVQIFEVIQTNDFVCLIIEYAERGDLLSYVKKRACLSEIEAKKIFYQIADAVAYLHGRSICHRDLKCENVLIRGDRSVALTDFGFSKLVSPDNPLSNTYCGSAAYASPELLRGKPYNPFVTDLWSLGCILFVTITGQMPFYEKNTKKMMCRQLQGKVVYPVYCSVSKACKDLVSKTLEPNIDRRVDISGVLSHPWLEEHRSKFSSTVDDLVDIRSPSAHSAEPSVETAGVLGHQQEGSDVDGADLYLTKTAEDESQGASSYNNPRINFQAVSTAETEESSRDSSSTLSSSRSGNHSRSAGKQSVKEVKLRREDTAVKTPSMTQSSKAILTDKSREDIKLSFTVSRRSSIHGSSTEHTPLETSNMAKNMKHGEAIFLPGPSGIDRVKKIGATSKPSTSGPKRSIDPTFQRNIENILRVPGAKYTDISPLRFRSKHPTGNQKGRHSDATATTDSNGLKAYDVTAPSNPTQWRTRKSLAYESGKGIRPAVGQRKSHFPDIDPTAIISSPPTGHSSIASERFHARQEGLVTQMRRIFESKDVSTNTKCNKK